MKRELAHWVNRSKGIQLSNMGAQLLRLGALKLMGEDTVDLDKPAKNKTRELIDESGVMGPTVAEKALAGSLYHRKIIEAWEPRTQTA